MKKLLATTILIFSTTGCATIISGTTQDIKVETPEVKSAKCTLTDTNDGEWHIPDTPKNVIVKKGDGPMKIVCSKSGYKTTEILVDEELEGMIGGNILIGGGIGAVIDAASGAAQKYPERIGVWMEPNSWASAQDKQNWLKRKEQYEIALKEEEAEKIRASNPNKRD